MGAIINGRQYEGRFMSNDDSVWQENPDGTWSHAVPLPFYGIKKKCECGKSFWKEENYRKHYLKQHTDGVRYQRTPEGLVAQDRQDA